VNRISSIYREISNYLSAHGAFSEMQTIRASVIADALGKPVAVIREALKKLRTEARVVDKVPKSPTPHRFVSRQVGNKPVKGDYQTDVDYILTLAASNSTAAKIVGRTNLRQLDMNDHLERETYNAIVEELKRAGFNGKLATYKYQGRAFGWFLVPAWKMNLKRFMLKLSHGQTTLD
jgi:DNA-binding Lrp family transcriptional regulator